MPIMKLDKHKRFHFYSEEKSTGQNLFMIFNRLKFPRFCCILKKMKRERAQRSTKITKNNNNQ